MESLQLQDIHLPDSASFWPLAMGWWVLFFLILLSTSWLIIKVIKRAKQRKYRRIIFSKFSTLEEKLKTNPSNTNIAEVNTLLRQLAITYYPRSEVASLAGGDWLQFLDKSGDTHEFSRGAGRILIEAPYQLDKQLNTQTGGESEHQIENLNLNEFIPLVQNWIKKIIRSSK